MLSNTTLSIDIKYILNNVYLCRLIFEQVQKINRNEQLLNPNIQVIKWDELMTRPIHLLVQYRSLSIIKQSLRLYAPYHRFLFDLLQVSNEKRLTTSSRARKVIDEAALYNSMELVQYFHYSFDQDLSTLSVADESSLSHTCALNLSRYKLDGATSQKEVKDIEESSYKFPRYTRKSGASKYYEQRFEAQLRADGGDQKERIFATDAAVANAAKNNNLEMVRFLLENRTEGFGIEAITHATTNDNLELIQYMFSKSEESFHQFSNYQSIDTCPLAYAIRNGNVEMADWFLSNKCYFYLKRKDWDYVRWAVQSKSIDMVKTIFKHGMDREGLPWYKKEFLLNVLKQGEFEILKFLQANPPPQTQSPITIHLEDLNVSLKSELLLELIKAGDHSLFEKCPPAISKLIQDQGYTLESIFPYLCDSGNVDVLKSFLGFCQIILPNFSQGNSFILLAERLIRLYCNPMELEGTNKRLQNHRSGYLNCIQYLYEQKLVSGISFITSILAHWTDNDTALLDRLPWIMDVLQKISDFTMHPQFERYSRSKGVSKLCLMYLSNRQKPLDHMQDAIFRNLDLLEDIYKLDNRSVLFDGAITFNNILEKCQDIKIMDFLLTKDLVSGFERHQQSQQYIIHHTSFFSTNYLPIQQLVSYFYLGNDRDKFHIIEYDPSEIYQTLLNAISQLNYNTVNYIMNISAILPPILINQSLGHIHPEMRLSGMELSRYVWQGFYSIYILLLSNGCDVEQFFRFIGFELQDGGNK